MTIRQTATGCFEAACDDCGTQTIGTTVEAMLRSASELGWHFDRLAFPVRHFCPQCSLKLTAGVPADVDLVAFDVSVMPGGFVARGGNDPILGGIVKSAQPEPNSPDDMIAKGVPPRLMRPQIQPEQLDELDDIEAELDGLGLSIDVNPKADR